MSYGSLTQYDRTIILSNVLGSSGNENLNRDLKMTNVSGLMEYVNFHDESDDNTEFLCKALEDLHGKNPEEFGKLMRHQQEETGFNVIHLSVLLGKSRFVNLIFEVLYAKDKKLWKEVFSQLEKNNKLTPLMLAATIGAAAVIGIFYLLFGNRYIASEDFLFPFAQVHEKYGTAFHLHVMNHHSSALCVFSRAYQELLSKGNSKSRIDSLALSPVKNRTPLHYAAVNGDVRCINIILQTDHPEHGFAGRPDKDGYTAIQLACVHNHPKAVAELALNRFEINQLYKNSSNSKGGFPSKTTALMMAARRGNHSCIKILVRSSQVGRQNTRGMTALMYAAESGHVRACEILVNAEAGLRNNDNKMALQIAAENGRRNCIDALMKCERCTSEELSNAKSDCKEKIASYPSRN